METTNLICQTELEKLVDSYKNIVDDNPNSAFNLNRVDIITRRIKSSYVFLQRLGKPNTTLNWEEFEIAQKEIRKYQETKLRNCEEKLIETPIFRWLKRHCLRHEIKDIQFLIEEGSLSDMRTITFCGQWTNYRQEVPTNFFELVQLLFRTYHGYDIKLNEITSR